MKDSGKRKVARWGSAQAGGRFVSLRAVLIERCWKHCVQFDVEEKKCFMACDLFEEELFYNLLTKLMSMTGFPRSLKFMN